MIVLSSSSDLVALCRTSRLFRNIATRLLYRTVHLSTSAQLETFLRTMESPKRPTSSLSLCEHVRKFALVDQKCTQNLSTRTAECLVSVIPQFRHLEYLDLLLDTTIEFTNTLENAYFKNLSTFRYTVQSGNLASLSSFLNWHPTITRLALGPSRRVPTHAQQLDAIRLPNLASYHGPGFFATSFIIASLRSVVLAVYPRDLDLDTAFRQLALMTALDTLTVVILRRDIKESAILAGVARQLPRIKFVKLRKVQAIADQMSQADIVEIATCLEKLPQLRALDLGERDIPEHMDREAVELWSKACKRLYSIVLHRGVWKRKGGCWTNTPVLPAHV
ncbi:hypothetical protein C8R45DRAFT_1027190 [Mycena sanguinolenta]|nr:hypothetical protein C8R45DRAFT_1027190 [Mycena sanguinolenta]